MEISKLQSRKFLKPSDGDRGNVDRLSELPDDILIHILAFLPTKIYVATSILGRRWRFLWARVPNLDFNMEEVRCDDGYDDVRVSGIINRVMFLHKRQNINSFRFLNFEHVMNIDDDFEKWMTTAIECNVQQLHLSLAYQIMLPICIFTCKTLVNLRLAGLDMPTIGSVVCLPALKKLQLDDVLFQTVDCFHHLLSGCPVLNELFITNETRLAEGFLEREENNRTSCCISSPTLNRLHLEEIMWTEGYVTSVMLDTPTLKYLMLDNYVPYFSHDFSQIPDHFAVFVSTTTFHNITELELVANWRFIPSFLEKANNLQVLTIHSRYVKNNPAHWIDPKQIPTCLVSHLVTVKIRGLWCSKLEFKALRYILKNAKVLKKMEIFSKGCGIDLKKQLEALKRISWYKRGSDACRLGFH